MDPIFPIDLSKRGFIFLVIGLTTVGIILFAGGVFVGLNMNTGTQPQADTQMSMPLSNPVTGGMVAQDDPEEDIPPSLIVKPSDPWEVFSIQVGVFSNQTNAQQMISTMQAKGYPAHLLTAADGDGQEWYAVRIGAYPDSAKAGQVAAQFKDQENVNATVRPADRL